MSDFWLFIKYSYNIHNLHNSYFKAYQNRMIKYFFTNFFAIYKMLTGYYQENKEMIPEKACERYQNLSEVEKEKEHQYGCEQYKNLLEDEKQRLVEYIKN